MKNKYTDILAERASKRNRVLIPLLQTGKYTLKEAGKLFGISRERVRQIHKKETGNKSYTLHQEHIKRQKETRKKEWLEEIAYYCAGCNKPVKNKDKKNKFCQDCHEIRHSQRRNLEIIFACDYCKRSYHPFHNWKYNNTKGGRFCSIKCYLKSDKCFYKARNRQLQKRVLHSKKIVYNKNMASPHLSTTTNLLTNFLKIKDDEVLVIDREEWPLSTSPNSALHWTLRYHK